MDHSIPQDNGPSSGHATTQPEPSAAMREVYLVCQRAAAMVQPHWAVWIPEDNTEPMGLGKVIHAVGSPYIGFRVQIKHHFDNAGNCVRGGDGVPPERAFLLGTAPSSLIRTTLPNSNSNSDSDATPRRRSLVIVEAPDERSVAMDAFETRAFQVVPKRIDPEALPRGTPSQIRAAMAGPLPGVPRCQDWIMEYIAVLVKDGILDEKTVGDAVARARALNPQRPPAPTAV